MPYKFSPQERAQIALQYHAMHSLRDVQCWWRKIYGRNAKLTKRTIYRCYNNLVETGSLEVKKRGPKPTTKVKDAQNIAVVKNIMDQDPDKSVRQVGRESALSYSTVYRILTDELDYHPWKPHYVQELHDNDPERRLRFACEMEAWVRRDPALLDKTI